ncbi:hypothetical protein [Helicobacter saguini]|uniref:hypothetical protein n=1 Tax=Helicobacter saguini TaxID=1548018 RepID=UPI0019296377|nr:hypothetical protein [Helicobacter saguini]
MCNLWLRLDSINCAAIVVCGFLESRVNFIESFWVDSMIFMESLVLDSKFCLESCVWVWLESALFRAFTPPPPFLLR